MVLAKLAPERRDADPELRRGRPHGAALIEGLGADFVRYFCRIKQQEIDRHARAEDKADFERREYFSRI